MTEIDPRKRLVEDFIARTEQELAHYKPRIDRNSARTAVIVETRRHPYLRAVVNNVMFFLGDGWNLQIFHGSNNADYVAALFRNYGAHLTAIPEITCQRDYDQLLTSVAFWHQVSGSKILIFQTDSLLRKKGIDPFLDYDYVGSPWIKSLPWNLPDHAGGNGGISLRSKQKLVEALRVFPWNGWPEDVFFVHAMRHLGCNIAPYDVGLQFGAETVFSENPLAIHSVESYLTAEQVEHLLDIKYE